MVSENVQALQHPGFARMYLWFSEQAERRGAARHRDRLLAGLRGTAWSSHLMQHPPRKVEA